MTDHSYADSLSPNLKLLSRSRSEGVRGSQHHSLSLIFQAMGELSYGCGLAPSVNTYHKYDKGHVITELLSVALINHIDAARIDVDQLFARQAFIDQLNTSVIQSRDFIELVVGQVDDSVEEAMQDATPAVLRIDSSRGTVFKDNNVSTVLSVSIHYGKQIIENITTLRATFGATAHLQWEWLRMDEDRYGIISSDDSRLSDGGFRLTLGPSDVDVKVTFRCALITD